MLWAAFLLVVVLLNLAAPANALESKITIGAGQFTFDFNYGKTIRPITIWTYRPKELTANAPVLFVMHGVQRDGERYRDEWRPYAERDKALVLV